jgi:hypothetical protein
MNRKYFVCFALFAMLLGAAGCGAPNTTPSSTAPACGAQAASKSDLLAHTQLGQQIGNAGGATIGLGSGGPNLLTPLMRGMGYVGANDAKATSQARTIFVGCGSESDLVRVAKRPIDLDANYTELLQGYFAAIDPGGTFESVDFYQDEAGCETDLVTRRSRDGKTRYYLVDTTGWQDKIYEELGEKPNRACTR